MELVGIEILEHFAEIGFHRVCHAIHEGECHDHTLHRSRNHSRNPHGTDQFSFQPDKRNRHDSHYARHFARAQIDGWRHSFQPGFDTGNTPDISSGNSQFECYLPEELPHG